MRTVQQLCPHCNSKNFVTRSTDHEMEYGIDEDKVLLKVNIPVRYCFDCATEWTDHVAEKLMEERVQQHLYNLKEGYKYLYVLRGTMRGILVASWHEITPNDQETKSTLFGMKISAKMNMGSQIGMIKSKVPWTADTFQKHLQSLSRKDFDQFIKESSLENEQ